MKKQNSNRPGFSLVEIIIALVILSVGVLAMGASTGYIMTQIRASELRTERLSAVRQAAERVRAQSLSGTASVCAAPIQVSRFTVTCEVSASNAALMRVQLTSTGPGYQNGRIEPEVEEHFAISILRPHPGS